MRAPSFATVRMRVPPARSLITPYQLACQKARGANYMTRVAFASGGAIFSGHEQSRIRRRAPETGTRSGRFPPYFLRTTDGGIDARENPRGGGTHLILWRRR